MDFLISLESKYVHNDKKHIKILDLCVYYNISVLTFQYKFRKSFYFSRIFYYRPDCLQIYAENDNNIVLKIIR